MSGPNRKPGGRGTLTATKTFLTVGALASTLVGWTKLTLDNPEPAPTTSPPTDVVLDLAPLPTLIPAPDLADIPVQPQAEAPAPAPGPVLRHVSAPPPGGGGGGGGGRPRAVASTHSSR